MTRDEVLVHLDRLRLERASLDAGRELLDADEANVVALGRRAGLTWEEIAGQLGRTRSAVWERHHRHCA